MTTNIDNLAKRWYTLTIKTEEVLPMWYVVEVKSDRTGNWIYGHGCRTKVTAVRFIDRFCKSHDVRVLKYSSVYDRMADEGLGKVVYERGKA